VNVRHWIVIVALLALVAAACGGEGSDPTNPEPVATGDATVPRQSTTPDTSTPRGDLQPVPSVVEVAPVESVPAAAASIPSGMDPLVDVAVDDLMARLGVPRSEIEVVSAEAVVWPDRGLGCPRPGMEYLQVQVEGSRIVLAHQGAKYPYHSGGGPPFLCER